MGCSGRHLKTPSNEGPLLCSSPDGDSALTRTLSLLLQLLGLGVCPTALCCGPGHPLDRCFGRDLKQTHTSSFTHPFLQQILGVQASSNASLLPSSPTCVLYWSGGSQAPEVHHVPHSLRVKVKLPSPGVRERQVLPILPLR